MSLTFYSDFLKQIFDDVQVSQETMHVALSNLRQKETRQNFIRSLSSLRQYRKLNDKPFFMLVHLLKITFQQIFVDAENPSEETVDSDTLLLINMSLTFFRLLNNNKQYPSYFLKSMQFFHTSRFWELAYRAEVKEKRTEECDLQQIKFDTLLIIALMAREFGVSKEDYIKFAIYIGQAHKFSLNDNNLNEVKEAFGIETGDDFEDGEEKIERLSIQSEVNHEIELGFEGMQSKEIIVGLWEFKEGKFEVP